MPQPQAEPGAAPDAPPPALWRHVLAMVYDSLLIVPLLMAVTGLWVAILGPTNDINKPAVPALLLWVSWLGVTVVFLGTFWRRGGQTLGMQAWRIKLVSDNAAEQPTWRACAVRTAGGAVSMGCFGLGFLWSYVDRDRRYWHDKWSGTHLETLAKKP